MNENCALKNRGRCYDFKNIFAEVVCDNIGVFDSKTKLNYEKIIIRLFFFRKNKHFFSPKIGENRRKLCS
jgi:hypothetical protein